MKSVQAHIASDSSHIINQKLPLSSLLFNSLEIVEQHNMSHIIKCSAPYGAILHVLTNLGQGHI
ncbi:hypothetical protein VCRA2117O380_30294 [Vibrio crassostreae]|nr:hypothetical protein VCRA2119O381_410013 [Vibrio crassostreae]CAK2064299.1 hypothetical protein VCRA2117O379_30294 [Vibrio crassostreae]CAK2065664.1 hypothetical protein VCRA2119O382_30294 [Vibrio crassostreae]CAK2068754.1 hypothetical protein VCRA2117O380_30294 [Vibrio crassostreae]CAK2498521.1 hypothetical protein VCRA2113O350_30294 [Vibrio crassostreae]